MIGYILSTIKCINFIKAYMLHDGSQLQPRPEIRSLGDPDLCVC